MREGGKTVAAGVISKVLPDEVAPTSKKQILDKKEAEGNSNLDNRQKIKGE